MTNQDPKEQILKLLAEMGGYAEIEFSLAIDLLQKQNGELIERISAAEKRVDRLDRMVADLCFDYANGRALEGQDLRFVFAALKIGLYLERIGDYAKNTAARLSVLDHTRLPHILEPMQRMGRLALKSLSNVLDATMQRDPDLAQNVWRVDADIDAFYNSIYADIVSSVRQRPMDAGDGAHLLFIARNIERIGDHISNIAELAYYWVKGERMGERPVFDQTSRMSAPPQAVAANQPSRNDPLPSIEKEIKKAS